MKKTVEEPLWELEPNQLILLPESRLEQILRDRCNLLCKKPGVILVNYAKYPWPKLDIKMNLTRDDRDDLMKRAKASVSGPLFQRFVFMTRELEVYMLTSAFLTHKDRLFAYELTGVTPAGSWRDVPVALAWTWVSELAKVIQIAE